MLANAREPRDRPASKQLRKPTWLADEVDRVAGRCRIDDHDVDRVLVDGAPRQADGRKLMYTGNGCLESPIDPVLSQPIERGRLLFEEKLGERAE